MKDRIKSIINKVKRIKIKVDIEKKEIVVRWNDIE